MRWQFCHHKDMSETATTTTYITAETTDVNGIIDHIELPAQYSVGLTRDEIASNLIGSTDTGAEIVAATVKFDGE